MAMTVVLDILTGAGPTVTSLVWSSDIAVYNEEDTLGGTTAIRTPASGTVFSFIKSYQLEITSTGGGLSLSQAAYYRSAAYSTGGIGLFAASSHAVGSYVQATAAPVAVAGAVGTNPPTMNGAAGTAVATTPGVTYAAGPFNSTGRKGNLVEVCLGVDSTNVTAGAAVALPDLVFSWVEG